ncbi:MAG: leucyl aminopeptidase [Dehalococcoidia bacterium]
MKIKVTRGDITQLRVDAIIVNLFEGAPQPGGATAAVDRALDGAITGLMARGEIRGKLNELSILHTLGKMRPSRVAVVGLGKVEDFNTDRVRGATAEACRALSKTGSQKVATVAHGAGVGGMEPETASQAVAEGGLLGTYTFRRHLTKPPDHKGLQELRIVESDASKVPAMKKGCSRGLVMAEATNLARDLVNEPSNFMTPTDLAERARSMAAAEGLECEVLEPDRIKELGMGGLLGVAQGSHQPARFIILRYRGRRAARGTLGIIGKGLTFDSGGISIKPSEGMGDMKGDMSGAAAVIAAMQAIARLKPRINVTALVPATENLPGGGAFKPGDVLQAMNGKTIEIANTDAEGRLILADALSYARKLKLSPLVDVATLTGACHVALGSLYSGAFSNTPDLLDRVVKAGEAAGERHWPMPLPEEYKELNRSDVADVKNTGGRYGGAITAALFLAEFSEDTPWVHLDIAGTFDTDKDRGYLVKGATGVGVRSLVNLALSLARDRKGGSS